jgi:hypothetical protein
MRGLFIAFGFLGGCMVGSDDHGGQQGEEAARCDAIATTVLAAGEDSVLGFGGDEMLAVADGTHTSTLTWAKGGTTGVTIEVSNAANARFEDMEWVDEGGTGVEPALGCPDVVAMDATLAFRTDDGAFDESWDLTLTAPLADAVDFFVDLDLGALNGTYTVTEVDPSQYDAVGAFLQGEFTSSGVSGSVDGQAEGHEGDPDDPDSVVFAENFDIGSF